MLSLKQRKIEEYIDIHCTDFPFPAGVESLFIEEEMEHNAHIAESARNLLKEVNKVNLPAEERISEEQFVDYYKILMTEALGEIIVKRLDEKLKGMVSNSDAKDKMTIFKEKLEAKLEAKEGKILKDKLLNILTRNSKR